MSRPDEMQIAIKRDSKARGFDFMIVGLVFLVLTRLGGHFFQGEPIDMRPVLILLAVLFYQMFWERYLSRKAISGDEEYELASPKSWIITIICSVVVFAIGYMLSTSLIG
jgi:4-hydroxybenzoate polyprenyltransferase